MIRYLRRVGTSGILAVLCAGCSDEGKLPFSDRTLLEDQGDSVDVPGTEPPGGAVENGPIDERLLGDWWLVQQYYDFEPWPLEETCHRMSFFIDGRFVVDTSCRGGGVSEGRWEVAGDRLIFDQEGIQPETAEYEVSESTFSYWLYDALDNFVEYEFSSTPSDFY